MEKSHNSIAYQQTKKMQAREIQAFIAVRESIRWLMSSDLSQTPQRVYCKRRQ